jgi:hypothetical protein
VRRWPRWVLGKELHCRAGVAGLIAHRRYVVVLVRAGTGSVGNARSEICWAVVTPDDQFAFTTNFADGAVSRYSIAADGSRSLDDATAGIAVDGMPGLRDEDLSGDGRSCTPSTLTAAASAAGQSAEEAR